MLRQIVVYMSPWCGASKETERALSEWGLTATFVNVKDDREAAARLRAWVGFESVPTVVMVEDGSGEPATAPDPLPAGKSPRGVDRGSMITEASRSQLRAWLVRNGFLES